MKDHVYFQFDDDEPVLIGTMDEGQDFTITLKNGAGTIQFTQGEKNFTIFIERKDENINLTQE